MNHPQTFQELIKAHGQAAVELTGAGQTAWNGIVKETDNGVLGVADWNGTLELDQQSVTDPLRKMYATPGAQHDAATLDEFRDAFATLLHEQSHFVGAVGSSRQDAMVAFQTPGALELEEGITEAWTQDNLDAYLAKLGAEQIAPGIGAASADQAYPEYVPAARELAAGIGARTGQSEAEVLTTLNAQTTAGQWSTATDLLYNSSNLPQVVPADQETNVKTAIEQAMRAEFERLENLGNAASHNKEVLSASIGQDTVTAALGEIHRQEQTFAPPEAATVQTPTVQSESTQAVPAETGPSLGTQNTPSENTATTEPGQTKTIAPAVGADGGQTVGGQTGAGPTSPQFGAGGAQDGAVADTARALALAQGGQRPLGRSQRLGQESFGSQRGGDQAAGRSQGAERPSGGRGGRGE